MRYLILYLIHKIFILIAFSHIHSYWGNILHRLDRVMYIPNLTDFPSFSLERLLGTCFSLPCGDLKSCVLIDLHDPWNVKDCAFFAIFGFTCPEKSSRLFFQAPER